MANCKHPGCTVTTTEIKDKKTGKGTGKFFDYCSAHAPKPGSANDTKSPNIEAQHGDIEVMSGTNKYTVPIMVVAKKNGVPMEDEAVSIIYKALVYDFPAITSNGVSSFDFKEIPVTETSKQTLTVLVGSHSKTLIVELPEQAKPAITVQAFDAKLFGPVFQLTARVKVEPAGKNATLYEGVTRLGGSEKSDDQSGVAIIVRSIANTRAGKTVVFSFLTDTGEETKYVHEMPEIEKTKKPCVHCKNKKVCKAVSTIGQKHSCNVCLEKAEVADRYAIVACSYCS